MKTNEVLRSFLFIIVFIILNARLLGQPVEFISSNDLIQPISGFADYADCVVDMNGDFLDDVVRVGAKGIFIDYQQPQGIFLQEAFYFSVQSLPSWSICAGDINNDGFNDLLLADGGTVSFVRYNPDNNTFEELVMPDSVQSQRCTMADINNDGWLDGFVCHDADLSIPYRNIGDGTMIPDTNLIHTADRPGNYSAIWVDYDYDDDLDLYLFRSMGSLDYPYSIGGVGQISGSSFAENYYYYFYNWDIVTPDMEYISERIPVHVIVTSTPPSDDHENIRMVSQSLTK